MALQFVERVSQTRIGQIHPTDHGAHKVMSRREIQQPARLLERGMCLNRYRAIEAVARQNGLVTLRQKTLMQRGRLGRHPVIDETVDVPEMLVRVNSHQQWIRRKLRN